VCACIGIRTMMTTMDVVYLLHYNNVIYCARIYVGQTALQLPPREYALHISFLEAATRFILAIKKEIWPTAGEPSGRRLPVSTSSYTSTLLSSPRKPPHHFRHRLSNDVVSTFAPPRKFPAYGSKCIII